MDIHTKLVKLSRSPTEICERARHYVYQKRWPTWSYLGILEEYFHLFSRRDPIYHSHSACGITSSAIMDLNPFDQRGYRSLKSLDEIRNNLQDFEPGVFEFSIDYGEYLIDGKVESLDHAFIILKYDGHYELVQSYVNEYDLQWNITYGRQIFNSFEALELTVLNLIFKAEPTSPQFIKQWYNLSKIRLGTSIVPSRTKYYWSATRTTDYPPWNGKLSYMMAGVNTVFLGMGLVGIVGYSLYHLALNILISPFSSI